MPMSFFDDRTNNEQRFLSNEFPMPMESYLDLVGRDKNSKAFLINKFGENQSCPTGGEEIWSASVAYAGWITSAVAMRVAAGGNAADDDGGLGAQTIRIFGLDENCDLAQEDITLNGVDASSATTTTFFRVFRAQVLTCGTYNASNTGLITIETTGAVKVAEIPVEKGQTLMAIYAVPAGHTGYIINYDLSVDSTKIAIVELFTRENLNDVTTPFQSKRQRHSSGQSTGGTFPAVKYMTVSGCSDIWVEAAATTGTTGVYAQFLLLVVAD